MDRSYLSPLLALLLGISLGLRGTKASADDARPWSGQLDQLIVETAADFRLEETFHNKVLVIESLTENLRTLKRKIKAISTAEEEVAYSRASTYLSCLRIMKQQNYNCRAAAMIRANYNPRNNDPSDLPPEALESIRLLESFCNVDEAGDSPPSR